MSKMNYSCIVLDENDRYGTYVHQVSAYTHEEAAIKFIKAFDDDEQFGNLDVSNGNDVLISVTNMINKKRINFIGTGKIKVKYTVKETIL